MPRLIKYSLFTLCFLLSISLYAQESKLANPIKYRARKPLIPVHARLYAGFEGGWSHGLGKGDNSVGSSTILLVATDARVQSGYLLGLNVGLRCFSAFRFDLSYTYFDNPYKWVIVTPGVTIKYPARLQSYMVLANGYFHFIDCGCLRKSILTKWGVDPYIGVGMGWVFNQLTDIQEIFPTDSGTVRSGRISNLAGRIGIGFFKPFWKGWVIDCAGFVNYIGIVTSGSTRTFNNNTSNIGLYRFTNNWIGSVSAGLKHAF